MEALHQHRRPTGQSWLSSVARLFFSFLAARAPFSPVPIGRDKDFTGQVIQLSLHLEQSLPMCDPHPLPLLSSFVANLLPGSTRGFVPLPQSEEVMLRLLSISPPRRTPFLALSSNRSTY